MFTRWGDLVYRFRFAVIGVVGAALLALGAYGTGLNDRLTQSGWFDPGSESVQGAELADASFGRDHLADVIVMYNAPEGTTIDDPAFSGKIIDNLNAAVTEHPDRIGKINGTYWKVGDAPSVPSTFGSKDKKHAFASVAIVGDNDTTIMANYRAVADIFYIPGVDVEVSGLQPLGVTLNDTMAHDIKRMEMLALPAVAVLLFFIFGGIVAAALPLIIGGLTIIGATGLVMVLTNFTDVNSFVTGVVSMIGLGLAIDYGLFIVSRFREELAEGYDTRAAVRRSVVTAGRTVVFSATMIIASLGGVLLFPQGFLRSVAYGTIATVSLAALTAVTILPAMLAVLGPRVDMLGLKRFRKTQTAEQIENGFWGRLTRWVMKHPLKIAIPVTVGLLLLIIPVKNVAFGGINEKYLPPDNSTRLALEHFYEVFPQKKTDPIQLVFVVDNGGKADTDAIGQVWKQANLAPGLVEPFGVPSNPPDDRTIYRTSATLVDPTGNAEPTIDYLRSIEVPDNVTMYVTGQPTLMADSIDTLLELMPWMILIVLLSTFVLMFLTFGSLVLPIKAALMSALGLGSTLGILTWIFIDGNGAGILNFTPQPISAPVLMLIIAIIYGLSTDYEVFLLSRMVEARAQGASTTEAVRIGTAQTGRIITAAALILLVVTGAFAFSDMVMMQYIAYGMIAALLIDATVLRMLLVPAIMKLLGDDCWWAPKWMKRIQEKIGMGEPILDDERPQKGAVVDLVKTTPITDPPTMQMTAVPDSKLAKTPRRPRTVAEIEAEAPTQHLDKVTDGDSARPRMAKSPDPTRPRASMLADEPTRTLPVVQPGSTPPDSGEPTQILPIVKPDAPESDQGQRNSPSTGSPDTGLNLPDSGDSSPIDSGSAGAQQVTPGDTGLDLPGSTVRPGSPSDGRISLPGRPIPRSTGNTSGGTNSNGHHDTTANFGDPHPVSTNGSAGFGETDRPRNGQVDGPGVIGAGHAAPETDGVIGSGHRPDDLPGVIGSPRNASAGADEPRGGSIAPRDPGSPAPSSQMPSSLAPGSQTPSAPAPSSPVPGSPAPRSQTPSAPAPGSPVLGSPAPGSQTPGAPRGSERVQPPSGYVPPRGENPSVPQVSTPGTAGFTDEPTPRPSIVTPTRPSTSSSPPPGIVTPPGIVNPPRPSMITPQPRPTEPPAGGTFSGFTPLPTPEPESRATDDEDPTQDPPFVPPATDLSVTPGAHRAEAPTTPETPASPPDRSPFSEAPTDLETPAPRLSRSPFSEAPTDLETPGPRLSRSPFSEAPTDPETPGPRLSRNPFSAAPTDPETPANPFDQHLHSEAPTDPETPSPRLSRSPFSEAPTDPETPGPLGRRPLSSTPTDPETPSRPPVPRGGQETPPTRGIFGTPVPVEPQEPSAPWTGDSEAPAADRGPVFSPVTPGEPTDSQAPNRASFVDAPGATPPATDNQAPTVLPAPANATEQPFSAFAPNVPSVTPDRPHFSPTPHGEQSPVSDFNESAYQSGSTDGEDGPNASTDAGRDNPVSFSDNTFAADSMFSPVNPTRSPNTADPNTPRDTGEEVSRTATPPATTWHGAAETARGRRSDTPPQGPVGWAPPREHAATPTDQDQASGWQAPDGFTAVPADPAANGTPDESDTATPESETVQDDNRNEIENWMAQLRSSRRGTAADDEGRHTGNEGRTVSVNELLRRREDDSE